MMFATPGVNPPAQKQRLEWLDFFRGAAVQAMIETHVVNTFLSGADRSEAWFSLLNYFNGLIAPSFLFIAGFAQGMSWRESAVKPFVFARRARRLLVIAAVGYALHFPWGDLAAARWADALRTGSQVDVLQCLAVSLMIVAVVQWLVWCVPGRWRLAVQVCACALLLAGAVYVALRVQEWSGRPVPLAAFVNGRTGSLFPLFPWMGFVLAGVLAGVFLGNPVACLIGAVVLGGVCFEWRPVVVSALHPEFFVERVAWVLGLAALCQWAAWWWRPRAVLFAGRESLAMYASHLLVIEWIAAAGVPRAALSLPGAALIFASVLVAAFGAALALVRWRVRSMGG
jgi:uncharacterized membrane protein